MRKDSSSFLPTIYFKGEMFMLTKGKMIKALKSKGIRKADKDGATVQLEHLKAYQVTSLYYQYCK